MSLDFLLKVVCSICNQSTTSGLYETVKHEYAKHYKYICLRMLRERVKSGNKIFEQNTQKKTLQKDRMEIADILVSGSTNIRIYIR